MPEHIGGEHEVHGGVGHRKPRMSARAKHAPRCLLPARRLAPERSTPIHCTPRCER